MAIPMSSLNSISVTYIWIQILRKSIKIKPGYYSTLRNALNTFEFLSTFLIKNVYRNSNEFGTEENITTNF